MDDSAQGIPRTLGFLVGLLIIGLLPYRFLRNGLREETKSRRQANFAIACGLSVLVFLPLYGSLARTAARPLMTVLGGAQVLVGISGVALAIASLRSRTKDEWSGRAGAVIGAAASLLSVLFGGVAALMPVLMDTRPDPRTAWTYTDPAHGFQVKLPSNKWRQTQGPKGEPAFVHAAPRMQAIVLSTKVGQTLDGYEAAARSHTDFIDSRTACSSTAAHRRGTTPKGDPFTYSTCTEGTRSAGKTFVATSTVFCKEKGLSILMLFEGQSNLVSESGQHLEKESFETAAASILQSVE